MRRDVDDPLPAVPEALKQLPNWVIWRYETRDGRATKVPYDIRQGGRADTTDPATWTTYEEALATRRPKDGIGLVITPPLIGIDLDECRDPQSGSVEPWVQDIIDDLGSYTEVSPSGGGVHIFVRGELPPGRRRAGRVEIYDKDRYFAVTGDHLAGSPLTVEERDLKEFHGKLQALDPQLGARETKATPTTRSGASFDQLMAGDWDSRYQSHSEADAALCAMLARKFNGDSRRIDAEFRRSGLMRAKWDESRGEKTYGQITIENAISLVQHSGENRVGAGHVGHEENTSEDRTVNWRAAFKSYDEMQPGDLQFVIDGFLPYGINFVAGLSGIGKTWFALSLAKAAATGVPFLGAFTVPAAVPVIYLIPEATDRSHRKRMERMGLTQLGESYLCRTMHGGPILGLDSPELLGAARAVRPVIFLDTIIRFSTAEDENSATQNRALANAMFRLLEAGARAIVAVHHSAKSASREEAMTLENTLRGTGDLGAMADAVYGLKCTNPDTLEIRVECVKARDFEPHSPFLIQGRPYINTTGDFLMLSDPLPHGKSLEISKINDAISKNPTVTYAELADQTGISQGRIGVVAGKAGWKKQGKTWLRTRVVAVEPNQQKTEDPFSSDSVQLFTPLRGEQ